MEKFGASKIIDNGLQPVYSNHWEIKINGVDNIRSLTLAARQCSLPSTTFNYEQIKRNGTVINLLTGKTFDNVSMTIERFTDRKEIDAINNWDKQHIDENNQVQDMVDYKKTAEIYEYSNKGKKIATWKCTGVSIAQWNGGEKDQENDSRQTTQLSLVIDNAKLV